ncbi:hypothetical protein L917_20707 [Phytophthora nicotianae]|uniref:Reverse transcriptase domain-containing protein n=1 Tax=Phytophthora nicotianae TaxID=4792 RepID=W2K1R1_PHYNI|nr:hypothetical protein L917_20707 [Phytophthora nicotianae]
MGGSREEPRQRWPPKPQAPSLSGQASCPSSCFPVRSVSSMFNKSMPNSYSRRSRSPLILQAPKKLDRKPRPSGLPFRVTPETVRQLQDILHRRWHEHELTRCDRLASAFLQTSTDAKSIPADLPALEYESVRRLAEKIEVLARQYPQLQVKVLKGDVKSAFGLIPVDAKLAAHFAGSCGGLAIVDMTLPFGWTGLPAHYGAFGGAISFLVARESPKSLDPIEQDDESFFSFVWVDDHILLEVDRGNRLALAETALRLSMIATLGPKSINEKKFSSWSTRLVALGLTCDTQRRTISIPADKVHKALNRISDALSHPTVSRHQVEKLLRSLRYLAICCRSTRAFLQRLHQLWRRSSRFQSIRLPQDARHDLRWVASLLQNGAANRVATSIMADTLEPAVHLFMDASNEGIAVLYPAAREYIRLQFDEEERLGMKLPTSGSTSWFSINVREALSAVLSVLVWGPQWQATCRPKDRPLHVRCWIDNASAVAWLGDHNTKTPAGQELTRVLYCAELSFNLHVTSKHLDGSSNYLCGSRIKSVDWANSNSTKMDQSC